MILPNWSPHGGRDLGAAQLPWDTSLLGLGPQAQEPPDTVFLLGVTGLMVKRHIGLYSSFGGVSPEPDQLREHKSNHLGVRSWIKLGPIWYLLT